MARPGTVMVVRTFEWMEDDTDDSDACELCTAHATTISISSCITHHPSLIIMLQY